eukprot:TRINITY_DN58219_c1_g1_i1.p1 TRINITY_DN58219_c1_g1~~TRINITY_DN58219_c1_g1_i1.p1  ORF type:complete len:328 (+),score=56.74 TRINITY_DN58219_c1_g1_i1:64-1047(+)
MSGNPSWQQTMLRIKDPKVSVPFYEKNFGFTLIDEYHFEKMNFSLYFLTTLPEGQTYDLKPGSKEAHDYLWTMQGTTLELTHNHGSENDDNFKACNGNNKESGYGFGHIAVNTDDVYAVCAELEKADVKFQKKPDDGRMKGLAFALDPDGYWVEIVKRDPDSGIKNKYNFSQTMIRVKDPKKSLEFYQKHFGMTLMCERHFESAKFSLYFLGTCGEDEKASLVGKEKDDMVPLKRRFNPILELTHNHGTEDQEGPVHHNGNSDPKGFGHIGFLVDDVYAKSKELEDAGYKFQKKPDDGTMKGLAFALDPDGYWVEIIKRGGLDFSGL